MTPWYQPNNPQEPGANVPPGQPTQPIYPASYGYAPLMQPSDPYGYGYQPQRAVRAGGMVITAAIVQFVVAALFAFATIAIGIHAADRYADTGSSFLGFLIFLGFTALHILLGVKLITMRRWAFITYLVVSSLYSIGLLFLILAEIGNHSSVRGSGILIILIVLLIVAGTNALTLPHLRRAR